MRVTRETSKFKKDVKRMQKRGKDFNAFKEIIVKLASGRKLDPKHRDHLLVGEYKDSRECHIAPDWLLIYELGEREIVLIRTGTHADLFE
ncbi:MAG: type II toxin-antitoxin system YafQ family toxin [bacterium]